ncbi:DNA-binding response regulator [Bordetella holmesii 70147]|nr:DNA-binding response regulator [Bordetella holmesii 70147]
MWKATITCASTWGHLRQKLEADPARPRYLLTEIGVGYRYAGE